MFSCDIKNAIEKAVTFVLSNPIFFLKAKALSKYALKKKKKRKETKRRRKKDENRRKSRNNEYSLSRNCVNQK